MGIDLRHVTLHGTSNDRWRYIDIFMYLAIIDILVSFDAYVDSDIVLVRASEGKRAISIAMSLIRLVVPQR